MEKCSFCGEPAALRAGRMGLCPHCRDQLLRLSPESPTYLWYMRAVGRAMRLCGESERAGMGHRGTKSEQAFFL